MRFFPLLDFQYMVLASFLGLLGLVLTYLAWAGYSHRPTDERESVQEIELHDDHPHGTNPVVPLLLFVFIGVTAWALGYAVVVGLFGEPI
ncbi:hypothetical protein [Desulfoferrobacter suflitae]|uniref:hypothetical protein n=1 Tax=Desulfoferrobacter suflitae TaxID=2865782 RepID=UPI002164ABEB|nr:hypothetical protein [Desulfoferrobacter suflitae]MCK8602186.1 hypothetical protein [Desulfoferrobacter suflitae]